MTKKFINGEYVEHTAEDNAEMLEREAYHVKKQKLNRMRDIVNEMKAIEEKGQRGYRELLLNPESATAREFVEATETTIQALRDELTQLKDGIE